MSDEDHAREQLVTKLLDYAETVGVGHVWISTLRMSQALGHTDLAISDTLEAIRQAGARIPAELECLLEAIRRPTG